MFERDKEMRKTKVDIVFVVLVYRNYQDLEEFISSVKTLKSSYKIVIVNAYYDDDSRNKFSEIAELNNCVFLNIDNKGYSYGNNCGIEYVEKHFEYKYIVISNPDIIIKDFPDDLERLEGDIIAPMTMTLSGKMQNPMIIKESLFAEKMIYRGLTKNNKFLFYLGIAKNKLSREFFLSIHRLKRKSAYKIYAAHGAFVILSKHAVSVLGTRPYDEKMFLFAEEMVLAWKAKKATLETMYNPAVCVRHKVDGSIKMANLSVEKNMAAANIYYYETYRIKSK